MGAFGLGLVQGFATSTDAALKTHIQDNKDRFDENLTAALTRNLDRSTRYDKKSRDANDALELMSGLTNGNLDQAASVIASIGGVGQTQGFVDAFRTGQQTNPDLTLDSVVNYIGETKETDLTNKQAINQLVQPFEFTKPAQAPKRTGLAGMFDDPRDITTELSKTLSARGIKPTEINNLIKLQGAKVDWSKLATPKQRFAHKTAELDLKGKEAGLVDKRSGTDYEGTLAKIDTQLMIYSEDLATMGSRGIDKNDPEYRTLLAKQDATYASRREMRKTAKAYGTVPPSLHSKINPDSRHNSTLRNNMTANGINFELGINNTIGKIISGEASALYKSYRDTYQQLLADGENTPAMQGNILSAYAQQITSENTTMNTAFSQYEAATDKTTKAKLAPKMLYSMVKKGGKMVHRLNNKNMKVINPKIKAGDLVMINSNAHDMHRKKSGFNDRQHIDGGVSYSLGVYIDDRSILGNRNLKAIPRYNELKKQFGR